MPHLFYPIDAKLFHQQVRPILAKCWHDKSFGPGTTLWRDLLPQVAEFHTSYQGLANKTLVEQAAKGLSFDPHTWRAVVGEVLLFAADDLPLIRTSPGTLCCLLDGNILGSETPRAEFAPIQQALYGSRDLVFGGGYFRPDFAGYNNIEDVVRLAAFLNSVAPERWQPADLSTMVEFPDDEDRADEIAFVRESWPSIVELYEQAGKKGQIVACEVE